MRTTIFVFLMALLSTAMFLNIVNIGVKITKDKPMSAAWVAVLTNVAFMLSVIYLYNTSYGD
jgi:lipopolysaccharide export LptBFGC system permease protein LptF